MTKYGRKLPHYSEKLKRSLVREVLEGGFSPLQVAKRHDIGAASIYRWLDKYGEEIMSKFEVHQASESMPLSPKNKNSKAKEEDPCASRIEELEEQLRLERLKREAYQQMIKLAEERFKISIEKKSGTKQFGK